MSELLFILTTLYVAYVVYTVTEGGKASPQSSHSAHKAEGILTPSGLTPVAAPEAETPAAEPEAAAEEKPAEVAEAKTEVFSNDLRDPATGETAKVSNNYRGLKRWLKEALVTEGLLEKVYSVSELNE